MTKLQDLSEYDLSMLTADEHGNVEYEVFDRLLCEAYRESYESGEDVRSVTFELPKNGMPLPLCRELRVEFQHNSWHEKRSSHHYAWYNADVCFHQPRTTYYPERECYVVEYEIG